MTSITLGYKLWCSRFSFSQVALWLSASVLLSACGGGGTVSTSSNATGDNLPTGLAASVSAAHASLTARPTALEFRVVNTSGVKCAALPQDVTLTWDKPANGTLVLFDDFKDGKELCYISHKDCAEDLDTLRVTLKQADGVDFPGGGALLLNMKDTCNTVPDPPPPQPPANRIPVIGGTPATSVNVGVAYEFTPTASDADSDSLTFTVSNKPSWATFDPATGKLSGTPAAGDVGASAGIVISVTDGKSAAVSLPAFSLTVVQANRIPVIGGTPATSVNVGVAYEFTPTASDADSDSLTFTVSNKPSWATFDPATGKLSGTPAAGDVGANAGIVISVTDGRSAAVSLPTFSLTVMAVVVSPTPTGKLNDTGITECGYLNISTTANGLCPQLDYPAQDGDSGRDAVLDTNIGTDGHAGFSFTKLDANGVALADQSVDYATTPWSCVKDNVTGLIWEVKTDDGGLQDKDDRYNWYSTDNATNGGSNGFDNDDGAICFGYTAGNAATYCNTEAYVNRVNATGLCGANSGWRLPNVTELRSIVDLSRNKPAIDPAYFPNTVQDWYWVGTPDAADPTKAMNVSFHSGAVSEYGRSKQDAVRLVRSSQ